MRASLWLRRYLHLNPQMDFTVNEVAVVSNELRPRNHASNTSPNIAGGGATVLGGELE